MKTNPLFAEYLTPERLREGKDDCPCCGKKMRSYAKSLDDRLVQQGYDILEYLKVNKRNTFRFIDVWKGGDPVDTHRKICDANKLHYWDIIRRTEKGDSWTVTQKGVRFLTGKIQLPKRLWIFKNEVKETEDLMVHINNVDIRWQEMRSDYTFDYVPYRYKTNVQTVKPQIKEPTFVERDGNTIVVLK